MGVKCEEIARYIEEFAPTALAEDWDNVGLLLGSRNSDVKRVLVCLDVTSKVVEEAIEKGVDLIVSHHPFIFRGIKRITEDEPKGKLIFKLIRNSIGVYSAHTNYDVAEGGLNDHLAEIIGLKEIRNLKSYKREKLYKIVVFVPEDYIDEVRNAMSSAGAGWIGKYSDCSFMVKGIGTFKPLENTNPHIGMQGRLEKVSEYRLETIAPQNLINKVVSSMVKSHPYEEVAYDVYPLQLSGKEYGLGKVGYLEKPMPLKEFIELVHSRLNVDTVRLIGNVRHDIRKVATFCGSFDESWQDILRENADILITGDIKYHAAVDIQEMGLCVMDAGHYNTEKIMVMRMAKMLSEKFRNIDVISCNMEQDPFITY
jgi:dinuclear metal center YbgI/SA1388 family protein